MVYSYVVTEYAVAEEVEELRYNPEGRGFDSRWCHWNFLFLYYGPGVDSASNRNEWAYKDGRYVGLRVLPPLCADCREILEPQPPGTLRACPGL
jgi:hypothetical protein